MATLLPAALHCHTMSLQMEIVPLLHVSAASQWPCLLIKLHQLSADMPHYYVCNYSTENRFKALMFQPQYAFCEILTITAKLQFWDLRFYVSPNFTYFLFGYGQMLIWKLLNFNWLLPQICVSLRLQFVFRVLTLRIHMILHLQGSILEKSMRHWCNST
jgi:hypothetical protein